MTEYHPDIHEVFEDLVNFRDTYDWDNAMIVGDLSGHIENASVLPEVRANPHVKAKLKIIKDDINEIEYMLLDLGDDLDFIQVSNYSTVKGNFKEKVLECIDDLEKLRVWFSKESMKTLSKDTKEDMK